MARHPSAESVWDYPRPPAVRKDSRRVVVSFGGQTIADTRQAVRILETSHPPTFYLPPADVAEACLEPSGETSFCEYKGLAAYYHVMAGGRVAQNAAWRYDRPSPGYEAIAGFFSFYPAKMDLCTVGGDKVTPQPGGFYGGWITSEVRGPFKGGAGTAGW